jgi:aminomethyltransferase
MQTNSIHSLKKTPLHSSHLKLGAKMIDFGGWHMPLEFSGVISEHLAVRTSVGLLDVSHMGEIEISGPHALQLVDFLTPNSPSILQDGQAQYSALLYPSATFIDDLILHRISAHHYFLCVNASNQEKDFLWINSHNNFDASVEFTSAKYVQLAIQGPKALATLSKLTQTDLASIRYYWFAIGKVLSAPALIARLGYTGEDGFEIYVPPDEGERIWEAVLDAGSEFGILPCGLAARNTLRLEAAMSLYGHEIDDTTSPYEVGLGRIVKLEKGDFIGRDVLVKQKEQGVERKLVGVEMKGRAIARDGYKVFAGGKEVGRVTSGSPAPYLKKNIGLCLVKGAGIEEGVEVEVEIRNRKVEAEVVRLPFYSRKRKAEVSK